MDVLRRTRKANTLSIIEFMRRDRGGMVSVHMFYTVFLNACVNSKRIMV
jgi:hypothetical protein